MKKLLLTLLTALFLVNISFAQVTEKEEDLKTLSNDTTEGWEKGGVFSLTFGQTGFSEYWKAGGTNSISSNMVAGLFANLKKGNLTWDNTLDLGYGTQGLKTGDEYNFQKTDDKFDFASKLGIKAAKNLYYAALLNLKSQFTNGYEYPNDSVSISGFMSPGYLLAAAGIDYKPNKHLTVFIAPLTSKTTFVFDQQLADIASYGVEPGENIRNEFGGYLKTVFTRDIVKNVNLSTKLDLFSNYLHNPQNIDVNWEVLIAMKVNKFITANISTQLLYDDDIKFNIKDENGIIIPGKVGPRTQFKEILGIGLSFKF